MIGPLFCSALSSHEIVWLGVVAVCLASVLILLLCTVDVLCLILFLLRVVHHLHDDTLQ